MCLVPLMMPCYNASTHLLQPWRLDGCNYSYMPPSKCQEQLWPMLPSMLVLHTTSLHEQPTQITLSLDGSALPE